MAKPSNFHTILENVMSFLETLEELFDEDYKKAKQIRITIMMFQGKAKVW
jgi:hypothetical protein